MLRAVRLSGAFFFDVQASDPWVAETPGGESVVGAKFQGAEHLISHHLIVSDSAWVRSAGEPDMLLGAGYHQRSLGKNRARNAEPCYAGAVAARARPLK